MISDVSLIHKWQDRRILVLGDVMLDRFVYGAAERVSPEAPTLVLRHQSEASMLGGAGNVARNIVALGGRAVLVGGLGQDAEGDLVAGSIAPDSGIEGRWLRTATVPTTVKTRYVASRQQLMRFDREKILAADPAFVDGLSGKVAAELDAIDAIVLSDYAKGVLSPELIRRVVEMARPRNIPVVVDPKTRDVQRYAGATVMTPNANEAAAICGFDCDTDEAAAAAAQAIAAQADVSAVVLTRGAKGMTVWDSAYPESGALALPTTAIEVFDVSGAGDTVVAALVLALTAGADVATGARVANVAAGIAVGKRGTAEVRARELGPALGGHEFNPKIASRDAAAAIAADWKAHGLVVGFTNGCFDLIHPGHVQLLRRAKEACGRLVVALNTDASVQRLKGPERPVQNEGARSVVMAALNSVDLVTLFDEDTPLELIQQLAPNILVKGADYTVDTVVGADFVQAHGGRVVLVPLQEGHSTTRIVAKVKIGGRA